MVHLLLAAQRVERMLSTGRVERWCSDDLYRARKTKAAMPRSGVPISIDPYRGGDGGYSKRLMNLQSGEEIPMEKKGHPETRPMV